MSEDTSFNDIAVPVFVQLFRNHPDIPPILEVREILTDFMCDHNLTVTLGNAEAALQACRAEIENALNKIPSSRWLAEVVKPEFDRRKKTQPPPRPRRIPWGVKTTEYLHNP